MTRFSAVLVPLLFIAPVTSSFAQSFGYFGDVGPDFWSELDPGCSAC